MKYIFYQNILFIFDKHCENNFNDYVVNVYVTYM